MSEAFSNISTSYQCWTLRHGSGQSGDHDTIDHRRILMGLHADFACMGGLPKPPVGGEVDGRPITVGQLQ
jgi:hypothetical protein